MTSRSHLLTLQQELENPAPLSPEIREWLADGLTSYLEAGEKIPLCRCLGLRGRGMRHINTEMARIERDIALREAFESMERNLDDSDRAVSERLAAMIRSFEAVAWPRHRNAEDPPSHWGEVQRALFRAFHHGRGCGGVPTTGRRLRGIVT